MIEPAKHAAVPTGPAIAPMAAEASAAAAGISGGSTICRVYVTERDVAKTRARCRADRHASSSVA